MENDLIFTYDREFLLHPWAIQQNATPLLITKGKGSHFWDEKGRRYLDFSSQLVNVNAGHQHPKIIQAIKEQAENLCYVAPNSATVTAVFSKCVTRIAKYTAPKRYERSLSYTAPVRSQR
jgi:taurine--2-oxoglutarate transaminase